MAKTQTARVHREFCATYPQVNMRMCVCIYTNERTRGRVDDLIFFFAAMAAAAARF